MSSVISRRWSSLGIPNIYSQALSRLGNDIPPIYIVILMYIWVVVLLRAVTGFPIKNGLVISWTTGRPAWGKGMRPISAGTLTGAQRPVDVEKPADAEDPAGAEGLAGAEGPADAKKPADVEDPSGAEGPVDIEEAIVICYKYQY